MWVKAKKERGIHSVGCLTIKEQGKDDKTNIMEFFVGQGNCQELDKKSDGRNEYGNSEDGKISAFLFEKDLHETSNFALFSTFFPGLGKF